ncbi:carbohydrate-binding module family 1 protein [Apiospora arundinis]|uniref:Uncharacterized protein n=1 Tax=Apiospora arundinis TaxID=335852 RepID=A0ABR2J6G2_9PEZI
MTDASHWVGPPASFATYVAVLQTEVPSFAPINLIVSHWWFIVFVLRDCHEKSRLDIVFLKKLKSKGNLTMYIHAVNMHLRLVHNFFQNRI